LVTEKAKYASCGLRNAPDDGELARATNRAAFTSANNEWFHWNCVREDIAERQMTAENQKEQPITV